MENQEDSSVLTPLLYYLVAPIPAGVFGYFISGLFTRYLVESITQESEWMQIMLVAMFIQTGGAIVNIFYRIFPFIAIGAVIASILLVPKRQKANIVGLNRLNYILRANCVALITLCVVILALMVNPFHEKLSEAALKGEGIPLTWTQIFAGVGSFLLAHSVFMSFKTEALKTTKTKIKGTEKTLDNEDEFFMPEENTHFSSEMKNKFVNTVQPEVDRMINQEMEKARAEGKLTPEAEARVAELKKLLGQAISEGFEKGVEDASKDAIKKGVKDGLDDFYG